MKAVRPTGLYVFHGGCDGCPNGMEVCPTCQYMEADWSLPVQNPIELKQEREAKDMANLARKLRKISQKKMRVAEESE